MPPRRQFYDPFIETPSDMSQPEPVPVYAIQANKLGMYLHLDDIVATLRGWDMNDAADAFAEMSTPTEETVQAVVDNHPEVARIEVYPDLDGKWHARPVGSDGAILTVTDGSFDRDYVEREAAERWPGKKLFELQDAMGDSIWDEQDTSFSFNGRRRPSPRRLWS